MPRPFDVKSGLITAAPNISTAASASPADSVTTVSGIGNPARTSSTVMPRRSIAVSSRAGSLSTGTPPASR